MRALTVLRKVAQRDVDEKRMELARLEHLVENLNTKLEQLQAALISEQQVVQHHPQLSHAYSSFAKKNQQQQTETHQEINVLNQQIEQQMAALLESYFELKRYENALQQRQEELSKQEAKLEAAELSEMAINKHSRTISGNSDE